MDFPVPVSSPQVVFWLHIVEAFGTVLPMRFRELKTGIWVKCFRRAHKTVDLLHNGAVFQSAEVLKLRYERSLGSACNKVPIGPALG